MKKKILPVIFSWHEFGEIKNSQDLLGQCVLLPLCQSLCGLCYFFLRDDWEVIVLLTRYNPSRITTILM